MINLLLETGTMLKKNKANITSVPFELRVLTSQHQDEAIFLQNLAGETLGEMYHPVSIDMVQNAMLNQKSVGLFVNNKLVGMKMVYTGEEIVDAAKDFLESKNFKNSIAFFSGDVILPEFRGNKMNLRMHRHANYLLKKDNFEHSYTLSHPYNYFSVDNQLAAGLLIVDLNKKFHGDLRYVLYANLKNAEVKRPYHTVCIENKKIAEQMELIKESYVGYMGIKQENFFYICYRK